MRIDTLILIEDLAEPAEDDDAAAADVPAQVAEATDVWGPPA
jgi:hypothetical protein